MIEIYVIVLQWERFSMQLKCFTRSRNVNNSVLSEPSLIDVQRIMYNNSFRTILIMTIIIMIMMMMMMMMKMLMMIIMIKIIHG